MDQEIQMLRQRIEYLEQRLFEFQEQVFALQNRVAELEARPVAVPIDAADAAPGTETRGGVLESFERSAVLGQLIDYRQKPPRRQR
jgi:BMFP domain-containing protein YqiC